MMYELEGTKIQKTDLREIAFIKDIILDKIHNFLYNTSLENVNNYKTYVESI